MSRTDRLIDKALAATELSRGVRSAAIGAVVAKGNRVLAVAANSGRNNTLWNPPLNGLTWHAEHTALKQCDARGATIYVARIKKDGRPGMARPCNACYKRIVQAGVYTIVYTNWNGETQIERVR